MNGGMDMINEFEERIKADINKERAIHHRRIKNLAVFKLCLEQKPIYTESLSSRRLVKVKFYSFFQILTKCYLFIIFYYDFFILLEINIFVKK
jgi:hypothetical protein